MKKHQRTNSDMVSARGLLAGPLQFLSYCLYSKSLCEKRVYLSLEWAEHLPSPRMGHSSYNSNLNALTGSSCLSQQSLGSIVSSLLPCSDWSLSPPDAMASSNPWCTMCGKGRRSFATWVRGSRTGGNAAGHENGWIAWQKRSCCRSWRYCWDLGCRLQKCFGNFRHPKGGVGIIWIRIWRCMGYWGRRMQLFLWSMMDIGGMGKRIVCWEIRGKVLHCSQMHHQVLGWYV